MSFSERLKELMGEQTTSAFSRKCGIGEASVRQYLNGGTPGIDKAEAIASANGVNLEWLITGRGTKNAGDKGPFVSIPVLPTRVSTMGGPAVELDEIGDAFPLPRIWAERWRLKEQFLCLIWGVEGMEDTLQSHDKLICYSAPYQLHGDGLFAIRQDGVHTVKRLQFLPDKIRVISDHPDYEPYDVSLPVNPEEFSVIARVLFRCNIQRV